MRRRQLPRLSKLGPNRVKLGEIGCFLPLGANWVQLGEIGCFDARHQEHHHYAGDPVSSCLPFLSIWLAAISLKTSTHNPTQAVASLGGLRHGLLRGTTGA